MLPRTHANLGIAPMRLNATHDNRRSMAPHSVSRCAQVGSSQVSFELESRNRIAFMTGSAGIGSRYRFGVFEADGRTGELRKQGRVLRLRGRPFDILLLLLARGGDVISRDELRQQLWPADTFVDFDHGLNSAMNRLRDALGDSAESPRFIETLPKRGYRFIAPIEAIRPDPTPVEAEPSAGRPAALQREALAERLSAAERQAPAE